MKYIELRTDTVTLLTNQMRESILTSPFGDWSYGEDPTVNQLQAYASQLLGTQQAAYVLSSTFGNQCVLLTAGKPGQQLIIRDESHIIAHQNGSPGRIARLITKTISDPFGYITPELLRKHLRKKKDSQSPHTSVLVLEYPTFQGGIPPLQTIHQCGKIAREQGVHVHIDAARLFYALAQTKGSPKDIMKYADTMSVCLGKGLLAPLGSIVVGSKQFMKLFKANRKMMGGILRKPGVVAGAALIALKKTRLDSWKVNQMARQLSSRLKQIAWIEVLQCQTNMVYYQIKDQNIDTNALTKYLYEEGVLCVINSSGPSRFVINPYICEPQIQKIMKLLTQWKIYQK